MGSCVAREPPAAPPESCAPAVALGQGCKEGSVGASGGTLSGSSTSPSAFRVTALASSSLGGLVQTVKDHVTKPTAMARGRVAHLIEWKGWSAPRAGWEPSWAAQEEEEEECYADLADELKEARFAAGVAEQFAITEATLSAWSSLDDGGLCCRGALQDAAQLQDLGILFPQEDLLLGPQATSADSSQAVSPPLSRASPLPDGHSVANGWRTLAGSVEQPPASRGGQESSPGSLWQPRSSPSLRFVDSSSLSEDEVFYN